MSLGKYIAEQIIIDEINRSDMPQISSDNIPDMIKMFDKYSIPYNYINIKCDKLSPIQDNIIKSKVENIVLKMAEGNKLPPIIISNDNFIVDGHHRWVAYKQLNKDSINAIKIGLPKLAALSLFGKVTNNLTETVNKINKIICIYPGRFQPFHSGHYYSYQDLVKKFGVNNVYITTTDKTDPEKSPFNFNEKAKIMTTMFNIPKSRIIRVKEPYKSNELLNKFDSKTTGVVVALGEKDSNRLGSGTYYKPFKGTNKINSGYLDNGFIYIVPQLQLKIHGKLISGTIIRNRFNKELFKTLYPKYDDSIYNLMLSKFHTNEENIIKFLENNNIIDIITESNNSGTGQIVDDGPQSFYGNFNIYKKFSRKRARTTGWEIINYLLSEKEEFYHHPTYPFDGPVNSVSFYEAGAQDKSTPVNQQNLASNVAYQEWQTHVDRFTELLGWKFISYLDAENSVKTRSLSENKIITEGGSYGHLSHPFEDNDLTFGDLKNMVNGALEGNLELAQEKCINGDSIVLLKNNGKTKIKDVVDNKIKDNILSYNIENDDFSYKHIIGYANNGKTEKWLEIELENGNKIKVTPNHRIYVNNIGYVQAKDLTEEMELIIK